MDAPFSSEEDSDEQGTSSDEIIESGLTGRGKDPNEVKQDAWYDTSVRVRITYYVFNSVAVCLAFSLGYIVNVFFSIMADEDGLNTKFVSKILLLPFGLIGSAVVVDQLLDFGLDGMTTPSLAQFRSSITLTSQACYPKFTTRTAELITIVILEGGPVVAAFISIFTAGNVPLLHKAINFLNHYLRGAVSVTFLLTFWYLFTRLYVQGGSGARERKMTAIYHSIDHMGKLRRGVDANELAVDLKFTEDAKPAGRCKRCLFYFGGAIAIDLLVLLIFALRKRFDVLLIGQFAITLVGAFAIKARYPKLLGRAFWAVFIFFLVLTFGLWLFAHKNMKEKVLKPLCVGPQDSSYDQQGSDLPLKFTPPLNGRGYGYEVCSAHWGDKTMEVENQFSALDLSTLAFASSYSSEEQIRSNLHAVLDGTALYPWNLTHVTPANVVGRWIVVDFPKQKTRVVAVRGTSTLEDVYADLEIYGAMGVFQFMNLWTPVLQVMGADAVRSIVNSHVPEFWTTFLKAVAEEKDKALAAGSTMIITGHSLGAALAGVGAAENSVQCLGFSPPGLFYQTKHLDVDLETLQRVFTIVQPEGDIVPRVDRQRGSVNWVKCSTKAGTCHKLTKTACELWSQCGDPRGRDWRATCGEWYTRNDLNL